MSAPNRIRQAGITIHLLCKLIHFIILSSNFVTGFLWHDIGSERCIRHRQRNIGNLVGLFSSVEDKKQDSTTVLKDGEDDDSPAGIGGAEFFGGNKQKEEFYDPIAEREAGKDIRLKTKSFNRFSVSIDSAFDSAEVASIAQSLQQQLIGCYILTTKS